MPATHQTASSSDISRPMTWPLEISMISSWEGVSHSISTFWLGPCGESSLMREDRTPGPVR